jgi:hypothetical protein
MTTRLLRDMYNAKRRRLCSIDGCKNARNVEGIELDHVDPTTKVKELSAFGWWASRAQLYQDELDKTVPLCTHHHRENTSRDNYKGTTPAKRAKDEYYDSVKYERGRCVECGLHVLPENIHMFDFHHRSPATKLKNCSALKYGARYKLNEELLKCHLVCCECHREITKSKLVESKYFITG